MSEGAEARRLCAVAGSSTPLARQDRSSGAEQPGGSSERPEPFRAAIIMDEIREDWALTLPIIAYGRPLHDDEDASGDPLSTRGSEKIETPLPVLIVDELEARLRKNRRTVFETQPCAEVVHATLGAMVVRRRRDYQAVSNDARSRCLLRLQDRKRPAQGEA